MLYKLIFWANKIDQVYKRVKHIHKHDRNHNQSRVTTEPQKNGVDHQRPHSQGKAHESLT